MKYSRNHIRPAKYIVVLIFTLILAAAMILIHGISEKSLKADIFMHSRTLEQRIWKAATEEYQRLYFISEAGRALVSESSGNIMKESIQGLSVLYGPEGQFPDIATGAGYFNLNRPELQNFYDFSSAEWRQVEYKLKIKDLERDWIIINEDSDSRVMDIFLLIKEADSSEALLIQIDRKGFQKTYVEPAILDAVSGYQAEWIMIYRDDERIDRQKGFGFEPDSYKFRPLRIITGLNIDDAQLLVPVPGFTDSRKIFGRGRFEQASGDHGNGDGDNSQTADGVIPFFANPENFLGLRHQSGSYYYELEQKAAVNYLESILLLAVIGFSFLFLFFQFDKLRQIRQKEKEFVASVTHELRTPLTVIKSAADNLSSGIVPAEKLSLYSGLIVEQSERLGKMIEEILLFSSFEDKKQRTAKPVKIDFKSLVSQLQTTLDEVASSDRINLIWDLSGLPVSGESEPGVISLIIENLVTNAVNHAYNSGSGDIRVKFRSLIPGRLQITVEDDGRGIEPRELKHLFEPFFRDSISRQQQEKGSGLGLFIARRKAVFAGGSLTIESPYRRIDGSRPPGCRFILSLPCRMEIEND